jgi:ParB/RepB/Spo0J family partition protein
MRLKDMGTRAGEIIMLDPETIEEKPNYNVRNMESEATQAYIRQMVDSIHASGTAAFPEITVHQENGKVYVTRGHCRRRAFIIARQEGAEIKGIRAIASTIKGDAENTLDLLNNADGLHLTPLEIATAIKRLISFEWSIAEIAKRRGCTPQAIKNALDVADLPAPAAKMVEKGEVSATLAVETVRKQGALLATDSLKSAVETAKEKGKNHATAKHMPKSPVQKANLTEEPKENGIDWNHFGPLLRDTLTTVLRHFKREGDGVITHIDILNARQLIKDINTGGNE